ncbi:unnamed protein product [Boreogadus saida]
MPAVDCDAFGDRSTQRGATSESLGVDGPGSSHMSSHSGELKILSVYGKGEGPLAEDGHDALFTASEVEALNSLSADHSAAKSLERGERLVCHEELSVQQTPDTISIKIEEDIGGGIPAGEDGNDIRDRWTPLLLRATAACKLEALSSLSADHSVAKSLNCSVRLVRLEELTGHRGGRKGRPRVLCGKVLPNDANMIVHMRTKPGEKPYGLRPVTGLWLDAAELPWAHRIGYFALPQPDEEVLSPPLSLVDVAASLCAPPCRSVSTLRRVALARGQGVGLSLGPLANLLVSRNDGDFQALESDPDQGCDDTRLQKTFGVGPVTGR